MAPAASHICRVSASASIRARCALRPRWTRRKPRCGGIRRDAARIRRSARFSAKASTAAWCMRAKITPAKQRRRGAVGWGASVGGCSPVHVWRVQHMYMCSTGSCNPTHPDPGCSPTCALRTARQLCKVAQLLPVCRGEPQPRHEVLQRAGDVPHDVGVLVTHLARLGAGVRAGVGAGVGVGARARGRARARRSPRDAPAPRQGQG